MDYVKDAEHKNLVKFYKCWTEQAAQKTFVYFQMEYCDGGTLKDAIESVLRSKLPKKGAILHGVLCGLKFLHSRKLIHRDIKPANIVLTANFVVKIADFGQITVIRAGSLTAGVGTAFYMAPEVPSGTYSTEADIFSLGITFFEVFLSLGISNHEEQRRQAFNFKDSLLNRRRRSFRRKHRVTMPDGFGGKINGAWRKSVWRLVTKMTSLKPERRPSASEILDDPSFIDCCRHLEKQKEKVTCAIVGDGATGKTFLSLAYVNNATPREYVPTVFDHYSTTVDIDNVRIPMQIADTAGQEDYDRLRPLSYPGVDVVLLCFSVESPPSYINIYQKWYPEIRHFLPDVPVILVATKIDLRENFAALQRLRRAKLEVVPKERGEKVAAKIGAAAYLECSVLQKIGIQEVFEAAGRAALKDEERSKRSLRCVIL